jgi:hypothetical protein
MLTYAENANHTVNSRKYTNPHQQPPAEHQRWIPTRPVKPSSQNTHTASTQQHAEARSMPSVMKQVKNV